MTANLPPLVRLSRECQDVIRWAHQVQNDRDNSIRVDRRVDMLLKHLDELEEAIREVRGVL